MRLTHKQKRMLVNLATPLLKFLYWGYRLASRRAFRRHNLPDPRRGASEGFPKRILVVRLDTIGDVLLSEPAVRALRQAFPEAQLDVLVGAAGRAVLSGNPCLDQFMVYDAPWHAAWRGQKTHWRSEAVKALKTIRELRRNRYDLAVELRGDPRDIAFMAAAGAGVTVGSGWRGGGFMLDVDANVDVEAHRVEFALGIASAAGASAAPSPPKMWWGESERQVAKTCLPASGDVRYIAVHLGAGFPSKCLPVKKFAEAGTALVTASGRERRQIVIVGGRGEESLAESFRRYFAASAIDLVGKLDLVETAAVFERCALFIGNDSGPMHLAAAVGIPIVTFFGPSEPQKYRPYMARHKLLELPLPCRPCDHVHCSQTENICMTHIEVADIVSAAEDLLSLPQVAGEQRT